MKCAHFTCHACEDADLARVTAERDALRAEVEDGVKSAIDVDKAQWFKANTDAIKAERDAAIAARDEAEAKLETLTAWADKAERAPGEIALHYRELLAAAERARDEVGIQLAAAQAEIARLKSARNIMRVALAEIASPDPDEPTTAPSLWMERRARAALDDIRALDTVPGDALAPRSWSGIKNAMWADANARVAQLEGLLRRAHAAWVGTGPAIDLETMERELADALPPTSPAGASGQPSGSTPAASSATSSSSEAAGSRSALRGTSDALRTDLARVTAERDRLASIQEDWHTVVRALGRDPGTDHETGRASDDIIDAARILRTQKPGLPIDEAATSIVAERDALRAEVEAMRAVLIKARKWVGAVPAEWPNDEVIEVKRALDALRARKVGG